MARSGLAECIPTHKTCLILLSAMSAVLACSGQKPSDETAQKPAAPAMTPIAGRSNGGAIAAETEDVGSQAQQKLKAKDLDMIVANQVGVDGQGLASDFNAVTIVGSSGVVAEVPRLPKWEVAGRIWDAIDACRNRGA